MCVPVTISVQGGKGLRAVDVSDSRRRRARCNFVECPCVANDQSGMDWVKAFALEDVDVFGGHMIQRCLRIEAHQSELLGDGVSISRNAIDGEVLEPCEDEGRLCWVGYKPCR